jgi:thiol-disulfide isomerase/thioredoxin
LRDRIYKDELNDAFVKMAAEIPKSNNFLYIHVYIGRQLFEKFLYQNQPDLAFATLDLLARNTSDNTLPRAELQNMYLRVDSEKGLERFSAVNNPQSSSSLIKGQKREQLSFDLLDATKGQNLSPEDIEQELIILNFWSISCKPCIEKIPELNNLARRFMDKVALISVNSDLREGHDLDILHKFVLKRKIEYPVLIDTKESKLMEKYGVNGWPAYFLIDKEGFFYQNPVEKRIGLSIEEIDNYLSTL